MPTIRFGRGRVRRIASYASYLVCSAGYMLGGPPTDVAILLSTPPLIAVLGLLARRRGARFVYKVEDLYPDIAIALGWMSPSSLATRWMRRLSRHVLSSADTVVALSSSMAAVVRARGARRVVVIPNWADGDEIAPDAHARIATRARFDLEGRHVVLYSGNLGLAHCFDGVTSAARKLAVEAPKILFVFVGHGPRLEEVQRSTSGLANVRFMPAQPRADLRGIYNAADLHLVTLRESVASLLWPSKYPAALAAGKPVLLVGDSACDIGDEIGARGAGAVCDDDGGEIARTLLDLFSDEGRLAAMGKTARQLFDEKYSRAHCAGLWRELLESSGPGAARAARRQRGGG